MDNVIFLIVVSLAYLTAKTHGLEEEAELILELAGKTEHPDIPQNGELLVPPKPIISQFDQNWPRINIEKVIDGGLFEKEIPKKVEYENEPEYIKSPKENYQKEDVSNKNEELFNEISNASGWDLDAELEIAMDDFGLVADENIKMNKMGEKYFVTPQTGVSKSDSWVHNSSLAADHAASGNFESAMQVKLI